MDAPPQRRRGLAHLRCEVVDHRVERTAYGGGELPFAARVHHHVGDPAHEVLAEADLRVHGAAAGHHLAGAEVDEIAGDRGRSDIDGDPEDRLVEAGADVHDGAVGVDDRGDGPLAVADGGLQIGEGPRIDDDALDTPVGAERGHEELAVGSLVAQLERRQFDVASRDEGVEGEAGQVDLLADDRPVDLALRGDVDDEVPPDLRLTAQPVARRDRSPAPVVGLARRPSAHVVGGRRDPPLGEVAERRGHLTAAAQPPATTGRIEVDGHRTGGIEQARAEGHAGRHPGGGEDHECVVGGHGRSGQVAPPRRRPPRRRAPPSPVPALGSRFSRIHAAQSWS